MAFKVDVELDTATTRFFGLLKAPREIVQKEAKRTLNEVMPLTTNRMRAISQIGATNAMRAAWVTTPARRLAKGGVSATSRNPTTQAKVFDNGTKKRFQPPGGKAPPASGEPALGFWVRRKLGISNQRDIKRATFVIGRAIRKRGLPGRSSEKGKFTRMFRALGAVYFVKFREMQDRIIKRWLGS